MKSPTFIREIDQPRVVYLPNTKKGTKFAVKVDEGFAFLSKSLLPGDKPDMLTINKGLRIGYYDGENGRVFVAYKKGAEWLDYVPESVSEKVGS
jgi:hypothetical protein